jgi:hypothetical protein
MQKELYENILERLGSGSSPELRHKLNFNLGRILLEKFGDSKAALEHIEEAIRINPDDQKAQQLAAGIHLQTTDGAERALQAYKKLVAANPSDIMHLQMLRRTYAMLKRYDEAWYIAGVLVLLGAASEKERAFYKKFSSNALKIKPQALDLNRLRSDLMASDEDWQLTEIIRILTERMAPRLKLPTPKSLNLSRKTAFDENQSQLFAKLTATVAKVLGITKPATHLRETSGWLLKEACFPPVMVMSPDLLQHRSGKDLRFELAHTMALFLPHHLAAGLLDKDTIRHLMGNVLKLIMSTFPEPAGDARANADLRKQMEKAIPAVELGTIRELVGKLREQGGELSVKRWLIGVDKTTARFGLLFANDIQVAAEMVRKCPVHLSVASRDELVNDLVAYTVSDEFIKVRKYLGISVF